MVMDLYGLLSMYGLAMDGQIWLWIAAYCWGLLQMARDSFGWMEMAIYDQGWLGMAKDSSRMLWIA